MPKKNNKVEDTLSDIKSEIDNLDILEAKWRIRKTSQRNVMHKKRRAKARGF